MSLKKAYAGKRVLITGHTGFKGSWLAEWLCLLGAEVHGFSLEPPTEPSLFRQLGLAGRMQDIRGDVRDAAAVEAAVKKVRPEHVFHLAAQPLVRASYADPAGTMETNVMGTVRVLDAVRRRAEPCSVVVVTTDKCYENREWVHSYREEDPMGGHDPYSASKGAAELVVASFRRSFFNAANSGLGLASARAGNVIGGGDWAVDRIVPDCVRALRAGQAIAVRNRVSTRPWQHVLEPLSGYLLLGAVLSGAAPMPFDAGLYRGAFNFGPELRSNRSVEGLVLEVLKHWPGQWEDRSDPKAPHEATLLNLSTDKAWHFLGWKPVWNFEETIGKTMEWYRLCETNSGQAAEITRAQIASYCADAQKAGVRWAQATPIHKTP